MVSKCPCDTSIYMDFKETVNATHQYLIWFLGSQKIQNGRKLGTLNHMLIAILFLYRYKALHGTVRAFPMRKKPIITNGKPKKKKTKKQPKQKTRKT